MVIFKRCEVLFLHKRIFVRFAYFCCLERFILRILLFCEYFASFVCLYGFKLLFCNVWIAEKELFLGWGLGCLRQPYFLGMVYTEYILGLTSPTMAAWERTL